MTTTIENQPNDFGPEDKLLSIKELAVRLGVTTKTVYNWRASVPAFGPVGFTLGGGSVRFFASDIERWIMSEYESTKTTSHGR